MRLLSFREALKKTKAQIDDLMIPIRVKQAKLQGQTEMAGLEEKALTCEIALQELCVASPINYSKILEKLDEIALLERRQKQFKKVISELFDSEESA
jgi:hypothetical protein